MQSSMTGCRGLQGKIDEEAFREYLLTQKVLNFLSENAVVTVEQAE